jgi:hypothetical protein
MERTSSAESGIRAWAEARGCSLRVLNDGHHWLFEMPGFTAEWWPSSAKLVLNRNYVQAHHAPHWADVMAVLQRHSGGAEAPAQLGLSGLQPVNHGGLALPPAAATLPP